MVLSFGIIFISDYLTIKKRIIRVIISLGRYDSCQNLSKELQILPLQSQYIFSLLVFVIRNKHYHMSNSDIHDIVTYIGIA
jgi:hypothetical protein